MAASPRAVDRHAALLFFRRDNILVLDVFFEALNYETIEQKKAYEVAGLLGNNENDGMQFVRGSEMWK